MIRERVDFATSPILLASFDGVTDGTTNEQTFSSDATLVHAPGTGALLALPAAQATAEAQSLPHFSQFDRALVVSSRALGGASDTTARFQARVGTDAFEDVGNGGTFIIPRTGTNVGRPALLPRFWPSGFGVAPGASDFINLRCQVTPGAAAVLTLSVTIVFLPSFGNPGSLRGQ